MLYHYINKPKPIDIDVSKNLREIRIRRGYTQTELAKKCGCSKNAISMLENNEYLPSLTMVVALCVALECKFSDLVETYDCCVEANIIF